MNNDRDKLYREIRKCIALHLLEKGTRIEAISEATQFSHRQIIDLAIKFSPRLMRTQKKRRRQYMMEKVTMGISFPLVPGPKIALPRTALAKSDPPKAAPTTR